MPLSCERKNNGIVIIIFPPFESVNHDVDITHNEKKKKKKKKPNKKHFVTSCRMNQSVSVIQLPSVAQIEINSSSETVLR